LPRVIGKNINLHFQNFLKTATDCCRMERQIQRATHSTCCSTMPERELSANDSKETMVTELEPSADIMFGERCTKLFWKLHPKPNTITELKVALEKTREHFPQNKGVPRLKKVEKVYVKSNGRHFEHLL